MPTTDSAPATLTRRGRLVSTVVLLVVLGVLAYALARTPVGPMLGLPTGPACTLRVGEEDVGWDAQQAMSATTTAGVGTRIGASVNGVAAAVTEALSRLEGRESHVARREARAIYRDLPDVADPAEQELAVARALLGESDAALSCVTTPGEDLEAQSINDRGLTPRADSVRTDLVRVFGRQSLGGFAPGGISTGHSEGSAHYDGRAVDVFYRPVNDANQRTGWQQATWLVAHAERLDVATVIFDRAIWTAARSVQGWRGYDAGGSDNPVLLHEDHVHVDVQSGA